MKLALILSSNTVETNWNALRLANLAMGKGDSVSVFLVGEGVEYLAHSSDQFDIKKQLEKYLEFGGTLIACGTCLAIRKQESGEECPAGNMEDFYRIVAENDKVLTF